MCSQQPQCFQLQLHQQVLIAVLDNPFLTCKINVQGLNDYFFDGELVTNGPTNFQKEDVL